MEICLGTTSTKDLKKLLNIIEDELEKRKTQDQLNANAIFNLIDDIRSENGCTIVLSDHFNYFEIGPDSSFSVKIKNGDYYDEDDEDE